MNKIFLIGRLAADPQGSITSTGNTMSRVSVACQDNSNKNEVYFFPCVAWQNQAKFINTYLKKGDLVAIDGKLVRRSYVNKDGINIYNTDIVIETIKIVSSTTKSKNFNNNDFENNFIKNTNSSKDLVFEEDHLENQENKNETDNSIDSVDLDWLNEIE